MPRPSIPDSLARLIERCRDADLQPPFSDSTLVQLRSGEKQLIERDGAAAIYSPTEAEFAVDPAVRGRGIGTGVLEEILEKSDPTVKIWAHGDHPAARALAASHGFAPMRRLLQLRASVDQNSAVQTPADTFRPGVDDAAWLKLNSRAFALHPEQGLVSRADLEQLMLEPWFDAEDFLVLRDGDALIGYCWLKVDEPIGEFYVVGIDPERQGEGLGRRLMDAGFARLSARGIRIAALYVESDNVPAVALYRSLGFSDHSLDIQYARA